MSVDVLLNIVVPCAEFCQYEVIYGFLARMSEPDGSTYQISAKKSEENRIDGKGLIGSRNLFLFPIGSQFFFVT